MHSVSEILLGTLPVKLPGNPSGADGAPVTDPFALLFSAEQHALGPGDPLLPGAAFGETPLYPELPLDDAAAALMTAPAPLALLPALDPALSGGSGADTTGSLLPAAAAAGGSLLPAAAAEAGGQSSREVTTPRFAAADPSSDQPGTSSDGDRLLQTMLRRLHGQDAPGGAGAGPEALEPGARPAGVMSSHGRPADGLPAATADALRPAGADLLAARLPAAEQALLAAAVDPRPVVERLTQPGSRHGRSESSRAAEPGTERSGAPGAEGFEQQLRASALRTVAPVTVARDIGMIAERVEMLMHRRGDFANVNLSLGDLGDLQISVRMEARQAHISFLVQDAAVRESLEQQLPRLRSLLEQSGVDVGDLGMELPDQSPRQQGSDRDRSAAAASRRNGADSEAAAAEAVSLRRSGDGHHIIDAFA